MSNSNEQRWQQRLGSFEKAVIQLTSACEQEKYSDLELAGLIKTFELCFGLSWNVLKDLLFYEGHEINSPRKIIRKSFEIDYIDESECEILLNALDKRNLWSHAYLSDIADEAIFLIRERFHPVLQRLHQRLNDLRMK